MKVLRCSTKRVKNFERNFANLVQDAMQLYVFNVYLCVFKYDVKYSILKGYRRYKMVTSQNVPSEAQVKNFFIS